jgi:serine/threonine protein kinase
MAEDEASKGSEGKPPPPILGTTKLGTQRGVIPAATPPPPGATSKIKSNTAHDRGIEVRMAIGVAKTAPHHPAELMLDPGLRLRQYELIRLLGKGGMGQVYLARDVKLARRVAIKFLATDARDLTARFLVEARTTAAVNHENIVVIHEVDEHEGTPHMVLEYLEGAPLRELMGGRAFSASRVVELLAPVARAVSRAHAAGIVHRDLKPENIFVTVDGAIKVLDFGIAKALVNPDAPRRMASVDELAHVTASALTGRSGIVGTPQYMSPEQFGVDAVDHRSDIWALGMIMWELLVGRHPLAPFTIHSLLVNATEVDQPMPKIGSVVHDLPERLERIVDRCLAKKKTERYPDAKALLDELEALVPGRFGRKLREDESPYPGLSAFQEDDADRFFGRAREISRMVARLRDQPLVGIAGPSGIGKSSFVRAGVMPALKAPGEAWETYIVRPGRQPIAALASVLAPLITGSTADGTRATNADAFREHEDLVARLATTPGTLGTLLRERAARKNTRIVLFVDQFEELYTLVASADERRAFTACLAGAADDATSPVRVIAAIRSDFLDRVGEDRRFLDDLMRGLVFLQPLGRPALTEALTRPLDLLGYDFENDELVDRMLDELAATPNALPLLQFAAARMWEARDRKNKLLTRAAHDAMGGISGALATHADLVLASLPAAAHRTVRAVFQRLVTPERTRALADVAELRQLGEVDAVIDHLVAARLLVVQSVGESGGTVEIVHESLIASWPTLARWLDEDQGDAAYLAHLRGAARQWEQKARAAGLLWRGEAADEARRFRARYRGVLPESERAYLDAVVALATRAARVRRAALAGALALLALIATGVSIAYIRVRDAERSAAANAVRAETALAAQKTEEGARRKADAERLVAIAALLTEDQLRAAAEAGWLTAEQVAAAEEAKRHHAEVGLAQAEAQRRAMAAQLAKAEAEKRAAAGEVLLTREQLVDKNAQLEAALAQAKVARDKAEHESARVESARAEASSAKAKLEQALATEKAHVDRLERERKKITTELK